MPLLVAHAHIHVCDVCGDITYAKEEFELGTHSELIGNLAAMAKCNLGICSCISLDILEIIAGIFFGLAKFGKTEEIFRKIDTHVGMHTH